MIYLYIAVGVISFSALCVLFVWFNNSCIKITRYRKKTDGAPKLKIVHLSDLHGKRFGHKNIRLIEKVRAIEPDFIAITGDIIHLYTPKNFEVAVEAVASLKEIAPVIYVAGNHEMRNKGYRNLRKALKEAGATVLDDASAEISSLTVTGLNGASLRNDKIAKITPDKKPKILLAHEPQFFKDKYSKYGYDLVLCGHAHGGQWRIPFTKIGLYAPRSGQMPEIHFGPASGGGQRNDYFKGTRQFRIPVAPFQPP